MTFVLLKSNQNCVQVLIGMIVSFWGHLLGYVGDGQDIGNPW